MAPPAAPRKKPKRRQTDSPGKRSTDPSTPGPSRLAQVRLRPDEFDSLTEVMSTLELDSTSDALREGLRLLAREAAEINAAREIRQFHGGRPAPLPDGVAPPTDDELAEADRMQW